MSHSTADAGIPTVQQLETAREVAADCACLARSTHLALIDVLEWARRGGVDQAGVCAAFQKAIGREGIARELRDWEEQVSPRLAWLAGLFPERVEPVRYLGAAASTAHAVGAMALERIRTWREGFELAHDWDGSCGEQCASALNELRSWPAADYEGVEVIIAIESRRALAVVAGRAGDAMGTGGENGAGWMGIRLLATTWGFVGREAQHRVEAMLNRRRNTHPAGENEWFRGGQAAALPLEFRCDHPLIRKWMAELADRGHSHVCETVRNSCA